MAINGKDKGEADDDEAKPIDVKSPVTMERYSWNFYFYIAGLISIPLPILRVITHTNPGTRTAVSDCFINWPFSGVLLVRCLFCRCFRDHRLRRRDYGAIRIRCDDVLTGKSVVEQERKWLQPRFWIGRRFCLWYC